MYDLTWLAEQLADLVSVIAALEAADLDATTYRKALASVERMMLHYQEQERDFVNTL